MKLARPELNIFAVGGDGDGLGIGGGHIPHVSRKNVDLVYILLDNSIYGLTKGQSSPTSPLDMTSKTAPYAYLEDPLNPLAMFLAYGASFIARGYSGKPKDLKALFSAAIQHRGFDREAAAGRLGCRQPPGLLRESPRYGHLLDRHLLSGASADHGRASHGTA
jgi:2-oxoglutarate ferredoxin oxidoreductase subunit beta